MRLIKSFAKKIADIQATVFLSLCFFLLIPLFALIVRSSKKEDKPTWSSWDMPSDTLDEVGKQY